ncbi:MAG TPA: 2-phospho-L-lactate transferase [Anaerolineae bacterium]|nr:2-phospho-L-lactate transferase [Anaerolineae bacterium]
MKVTALAGGVGGAKLVDGLAQCLSPSDLNVIINTADDFKHFGLHISPDIDTVCYTLAGISNIQTGWGREDESWVVRHSIRDLGGPDWFKLGDKDIATHLERTRRLNLGEKLDSITKYFCNKWGIKINVIPMSNDLVMTTVQTQDNGEIPFQEYFVKYHCQPKVKGFIFRGIEKADPAPGVIDSILKADVIIICPSNPWVSIDPILTLKDFRKTLKTKCVIAISPIINGKALRGPAAKMFKEMGIIPSALAVADHYRDVISGFVVHKTDLNEIAQIEQWSIMTTALDIIMSNKAHRKRLAQEVLIFCDQLI